MMNIKSMLKSEIKKTKITAPHAAGKLLIVFFVFMLVFTFVSRAVASFTVARVTVSNPQRNRLVYAITGMGEIIPEEEQRLMVLPGYRIKDIYVRTGEEVDLGTALYSYSMEDLQDKYTSIENEIKKIELLMAGERLRQQPSESKTSQSAIIARKQAKENLELANKRLEEAQKDYDHSISSTKEKLLSNKKKEYETAKKSYERVLSAQEKQLMLAQRVVDDANTALEQAGETKFKIELLITNYKEAVISKDKLGIYQAQEDLFEAFYGGDEAYEKHKDAIYRTASAVMGGGYYLRNLQNIILQYEERLYTYQGELQSILSSSDPLVNTELNRRTMNEKYQSALNSYFNILEEYERQIEAMEAALEDESGELKRLRRNDKRLKEYLMQFHTSIEAGAEHEEQEKNLFQFIYGDQQKGKEQEIKNKTLELTRAQEDYDLLVNEFDLERKELQAENDELKNIIKSMEDGSYDYEDALEGKKQAVEAAKEAVRIAKQIVEINQVEEAAPNDQNSKELSELVLQGHTIDLNTKKQELEELRILLNDSGEVRSPNKGVVTFIGVEAGRTTTGEEMIKLGFGEYVFRAAFGRDEAANVTTGAIVNISLAGKKTDIEAEIEKLSMTEEGMSEILAKMPDSSYLLGEKAEFKITTQSEQFDLCIPILAIREDNYGAYVLVPQEKEDILGTQLTAERVNVTILDKGSKTVAVEGALSAKSQVITDSNKYINVGDRIRIDMK